MQQHDQLKDKGKDESKIKKKKTLLPSTELLDSRANVYIREGLYMYL